MGIGKSMTGTPWHKERMHREEGDERRYKGRCQYYQYENNYCSYQYMKCCGSAHCDYYKAISDEEFKNRQENNKKTSSNSDSDIMYDVPVLDNTIVKSKIKKQVSSISNNTNNIDNKSEQTGKELEKNEYAVPNQIVWHKTYGYGRVVSITNDYIIIIFRIGKKKFHYPDVFEDNTLKVNGSSR